MSLSVLTKNLRALLPTFISPPELRLFSDESDRIEREFWVFLTACHRCRPTWQSPSMAEGNSTSIQYIYIYDLCTNYKLCISLNVIKENTLKTNKDGTQKTASLQRFNPWISPYPRVVPCSVTTRLLLILKLASYSPCFSICFLPESSTP